MIFVKLTDWNRRDGRRTRYVAASTITEMIDDIGNQPRASRITYCPTPLTSQTIDVNETVEQILDQIALVSS